MQLLFGYVPLEPPKYCNHQINNIPPLSSEQLNQVNELKQVQILVRHGARLEYP